MNKTRLVVACLLLGAVSGFARKKPFDAPGTGNPVIPGYFADPTVKKFGDTYYMYATTDGSGAGFGPAQVWTSKDFVNWTLMPMNWPDSHWIWAPDVMQAYGWQVLLFLLPAVYHSLRGERDAAGDPGRISWVKARRCLFPTAS